MYISFTNPYYLVFLFIIPFIIFFHFYSITNNRQKALKFANFEAVARIKGIDLYSKKLTPLILNILISIFLILALSGFNLNTDVKGSDFSYVIAIDSSESMGAKDIVPDRINYAKQNAVNFINSIPYESYLGIISFSGDSQIEQELTKDKLQLKFSVENIEIREVSGTDVYDAVFNSASILKKEKNKAILLFSDGQINIGNLQDIIDYANENSIIINTIGVGTLEGGQTSYGVSKLNEDSLKSLAFNTDGVYIKSLNNENLENSFKNLIITSDKIGTISLGNYLIILTIILFALRQFLEGFFKLEW